MDFKEYQKIARKTAVYTAVGKNKILYPALGLVGECGEVAEKVKKVIRDDNWQITAKRASAIISELGDCCWYIANTCCDISLEMDTVHKMINATTIAGLANLSLHRLSLKMCRHATAIASSMEAAYYGYPSYTGNIALLFPDIPSNLTSLLACIVSIARLLDTTIETVCDRNIQKLLNRMAKDTIHGDGDNR